jgi:hypothetical protein
MIKSEHLRLFCATKVSLVPKSPLCNVLYYIPWLNLMAALKSLKPTAGHVFYVPTKDTSLPVCDAMSGEWF